MYETDGVFIDRKKFDQEHQREDENVDIYEERTQIVRL